MEVLKRYKGTFAALFLFAGLFFAYTQYIQGTENDPFLTSEKITGLDGELAGQEIIAILEEIQGIRLDASLLQSSAFLSLEDYRTPIEPELMGRLNPFEPIGSGIDKPGVLAEPLSTEIQLIDIRTQEVDEDGS